MDDQTKQAAPTKDLTPKQKVVEALKNANNVLVTVSTDPSVDQLSACIGLTLMMNKLDKHATAVFSGAVPSALEFLEPGKTLETNTDSLRDFIISLDKAKADKLRYKVEDDVVKIFITPYRTSISGSDLEFTQGQFNVDVVVALGVDDRGHLDNAIMENGQILHDAVVIDMSCGPRTPVDMGTINWHEETASSLSEMLVSISEAFGTGLLDTQMSTAFLTGIVAETDRFSNDRTTPKVMTMSAQLMASGANQQLIANQLAIKPEPEVVPQEPTLDPVFGETTPVEPLPVEDHSGELKIDREEEPTEVAQVEAPALPEAPALADANRDDSVLDVHPEDHTTVDVDSVADKLGAASDDVTEDKPADEPKKADDTSIIEIDDQGKLKDLAAEQEESDYVRKAPKVIQPLGAPASTEPKTDLSGYVFDQPAATAPAPVVSAPDNPMVVEGVPFGDKPMFDDSQSAEQTLADLEKAVDSPHVKDLPAPGSAEAQSMAEAGYRPEDRPPQDQNQDQPAPPPLPPPMMPMFQPPAQSENGELNLPGPQ
jgi:hypothetical protein